ncbi:MAG TPA: lysophospholipase [Eudoraea sp.]|nr:lysophospholipase [Eudoraea sp.]
MRYRKIFEPFNAILQMHFKEFTLTSYKTQIYGASVQRDSVKGVVVLVHGFGEHWGRYTESVLPVLLDTGAAVVVYDNIGHGRSGGKRGHCPGYQALLDILGQVVEKAGALFPDTSVFLYGHSMGGNLVLNYAIRRDNRIKGIIATSPYLRLAFKIPAWKRLLGKAMLHILPSFTLPSGLDPRGISRIAGEVDKYVSDPLVHDKVSPMFSFPIMEAGEWVIANAEKLRLPLKLLHGTADPIIDHKGTLEFHQKAPKSDLTLFPGAYHELHHDLCGTEALEIIQNWLQQQL